MLTAQPLIPYPPQGTPRCAGDEGAGTQPLYRPDDGSDDPPECCAGGHPRPFRLMACVYDMMRGSRVSTILIVFRLSVVCTIYIPDVSTLFKISSSSTSYPPPCPTSVWDRRFHFGGTMNRSPLSHALPPPGGRSVFLWGYGQRTQGQGPFVPS